MLGMSITVARTVELRPEEIAAGLRAALAESAALVETKVRQHTPQGVGGAASGARGSIFSETREAPGLFTAVVGSSLPYIEPLESGSKPHFPPPSALIPWVGRFLTLTQGQTAEGVAWAIAKTIAKRGTKGRHMFERGLREARPESARIFERAGLRIEARLVRTKGGSV